MFCYYKAPMVFSNCIMQRLFSPFSNECDRPGGRLRPGEDEVEGLKRKLTTKLAPGLEVYQPSWEVGGVFEERITTE